MNSPKTLLGLAAAMLLGSAVFAVMNGAKVTNLRADVQKSAAARETAERQRASLEKGNKEKERKNAELAGKKGEIDSHVASAEAELVKMQTEKSDLLAKLQANEHQISDLQKRLDENLKAPATPNPGEPSVGELQAQLEDARRQLEAAEHEKVLLSDRTAVPRLERPSVALKREAPAFHGSIRGTVLAVNDAYNFVVLNLGNRQGVETNAEMLVIRGGTTIGKIRISSVEPATAIGDILGNSLARGVQVQPGDTVIYAGSNS